MLTSSIPVLRVADYPRAKAFWTGALGFETIEEAGEPKTGFGIFWRDKARVFLTAWDGSEASYGGWRAYFHTDDLGGIADALSQAGAIFKGPTRTEYDMDEIEVTDPDGNVVCFGQDPK
ncbi:MAG: VOC family protein [Pseudomonadota bacterium]